MLKGEKKQKEAQEAVSMKTHIVSVCLFIPSVGEMPKPLFALFVYVCCISSLLRTYFNLT